MTKMSGASRNTRAIVTLLLALVLAAGSSAPARAQEGGRSKCLSSSDECEAARLATRFVKRVYETGDVGPLVDEFFLPDFAERFQKFLRTGNLSEDHDLLFAVVSRKALAEAEPADLRRTFVALVNLWHHGGEFSDAISDVTEARHDLASVLVDDNWRLRKEVEKEAIPPALFEVCKGDPLLAMVADVFNGKDEDASDEEEDESDDDAALLAKLKPASVQTVARLRSLTEKLEKCAVLIREATQKLREELKAYPERAWVRTIELNDVYRVETKTYDKETFGFPAGTPFISARLFPYAVVMVRVEGRLEVVGVLPDFDGD